MLLSAATSMLAWSVVTATAGNLSLASIVSVVVDPKNDFMNLECFVWIFSVELLRVA